jgi:hypothetical protein
VLVIFYCQQCVTQMVPALSIDRKQIFRFSQIFASFFAGIFEKDDNLNASIQGAETLASLYLLYSADSARQKNSVDSFITGTRWLLRLADQFRLIENQRIKRQKKTSSRECPFSLGVWCKNLACQPRSSRFLLD